MYFKEYKKLEKAKYDKIIIEGFKALEETRESIQKAMDAYKADRIA